MAQQTRSERVAKYTQMTRSDLADAASTALETAEWAEQNGKQGLLDLQHERLAAMDEALPEGEDAGSVAQEVQA